MDNDNSDDANVDNHQQVPSLPHVVWRCIIHHLRDSLATLLALADLSRDLQDICRPQISAFFTCIRYDPIPPLSPHYFYHDILRLIWKGDIDPELIYEFHHIYQQKEQPPLSSVATTRPSLADNATEAEVRKYDRDLRRALENSAFVPADLRQEICTRFEHGDHDAALVVLLPILTRLKTLEAPLNLPLCAAYFESVSKEYCRRNIDAVDARHSAYELALRDRASSPGLKSPRELENDRLPSSELLILHTSAADHGCGPALSEDIPYMAIPSLHRIILQGVCEGFGASSGWEENECRPSCPEIYFQQSECSQSIALAFAQGLKGPCDIWQWFEHHKLGHGFGDVQSIGWDHMVVTPRNAAVASTSSMPSDSQATVEVRLDYEGGNPGYEYRWVSWLWHGKMLDWRRMDEVFELAEGDEDIEWLQGICDGESRSQASSAVLQSYSMLRPTEM
ncbi:hypothetical protein LTR86_005991 [Recurvomyces mirabilis]|nr:hypothetical protein LTR86_005991 [Recurvomyces mirabilis]